jgi:hypothetical protein
MRFQGVKHVQSAPRSKLSQCGRRGHGQRHGTKHTASQDPLEVKIVIVEHGPGDWRAHRCESRHGLRFLVSGDAVLYDEARHKVLGVAVERRERL